MESTKYMKKAGEGQQSCADKGKADRFLSPTATRTTSSPGHPDKLTKYGNEGNRCKACGEYLKKGGFQSTR